MCSFIFYIGYEIGKSKALKLPKDNKTLNVDNKYEYSFYEVLAKPTKVKIFRLLNSNREKRRSRESKVNKDYLYTIQVGVFGKKQSAEEFKKYFKKKGYKVYISKIPTISKYRVNIGKYKSFDKAKTIAEKLRKKENILNPWIITLEK